MNLPFLISKEIWITRVNLLCQRGVSASSTTVRSGAPVTITLTAATGSYTLSLNTGAAVGRYTATDTATRRLNYVVTVGESKREESHKPRD